MRTWHRWLGLTMGLVLLFVGVTGVMIQAFDIAGELGIGGSAPVVAKMTAQSVGAPDCTRPPAAPPRSPAKRWEGWVKRLHSGESFGPVGVVISVLSGFALFFFAFSGLWMYWQMWRRRVAANRRSVFWQR